MDVSFSAQLRQEARGIWDRIFQHPFLEELRAGTLPVEKFRSYIGQDYLYLEAFAQAAALALAKAPDLATLQVLSQRLVVPIEREHHRRMFQLLEMGDPEAARPQPLPTNRAYMDHIVAAAATGGVGETAAALLPCPWTYHELGTTLKGLAHPLYRQWASIYEAGFLEHSVRAWRGLVDQAAKAYPERRPRMRELFLTSSRYEYMFWDMAYRMEQWPG